MNKKKFIILVVALVIGIIGLAIGSSYALFTFNVTKNTNFRTIVGNLELSISDTVNEDRIIVNGLEPKKDDVALTENGYNFTITNTGTIDAYYTIYLDDVVLQNESKSRLSNSVVKFNLSETGTTDSSNTKLVSSLTNGEVVTGVLSAGDHIDYTLRVWLDYSADNTSQNKYYAGRIRINSTQEKSIQYNTVDKVLAKFKPSELEEVVMCDNNNGVYENCEVYTTLASALADRDEGIIILTNNITLNAPLTIANGKSYIIDINGKNLTSSTGTILSSGDVTFKNKDIDAYILTFDANGGNVNETQKIVTYNGTYGTLPTPTKTGYTFKGWNGKNLFDGEIEYGKLNNEDGSLDDNSYGLSVRSKYFIPAESNQSYVVSNNMGYANYVYEYDANNLFIKYYPFTSTSQFTTTATTVYIKIRTRTGYSENDLSALFQLEKGTVATAYEPYYVTSTTPVTQNKNHTLTAIWEQN